ncbi:Gfo/Idh/MocA family oxidoreductase [Asanoa sp. WMMD1127]|uniref:Gfo/Idh/MocA family protein n=1 Tax=Asanoa sp. WMMD1127 TaxID=3016107 RepID=UPI00241627E3|nr:Gfo/Idh/MocA family oxidoreductase [Asanoa sp. WMMD1127]MDG4825502.1 Gfo/Idh/MocA family oxidoreductase [Asanoa sp. WMMD1127]
MTTIPVTVVGAGIIGETHADAVLRHTRLRVAAVVDPDAAARDALAARVADAGHPAPERFADLAGGALVPGGLVTVCTPTGLHVEVAERALEAGAHVLVEKPLDTAPRIARRLADRADAFAARGLVASVVSQHRFDPASVAVAAAARAGGLGRLTSAVASVPWWRAQSYYDSAEWRGTWRLDGGGALMNQGVHTVDLLLWLLGTPVTVSAFTARLAHEGIEVEDVAVAVLRFASGALATLHATTAGHPGIGVRLQVHGTAGSAVIHDDQLEFLNATAGPAPVERAADAVPAGELRGAAKPDDSFVQGHLRQYDDVVAAIDGGRPPGVGLHDGLLAVATVYAVYASAALGRPVAFDDVLRGALDDVVEVTR